MFVLLVLIFLKVVFLKRVYHRLPVTELKRRARGGDKDAAAIYKVVAAGAALDLLLLIFGVGSGLALIIWSARYAWWLAAAFVLLGSWLLLWSPPVRVGGPAWRFVVATAPYVFKILNLLNPVLTPLARLLPASARLQVHTGAYERTDLLELFKRQAAQPDNRIPKEDLQIAASALTFGDKKVSSVMTPRKVVRFVSEDEVVGPMLMDELHKTGFSRFPVVRGSAKAASPSVVGTLYLKDVTEISQANKGKVKDLMHKDIYFINEDCSLHQALNAMTKNRHHLLVVVDKFEEMVGVITMEDVLEQVIGQPIVDEFDRYDDLRAVAAMQAEREKASHKHEVESTAEPETPVEADVPTTVETS